MVRTPAAAIQGLNDSLPPPALITFRPAVGPDKNAVSLAEWGRGCGVARSEGFAPERFSFTTGRTRTR
jgi:hypothetical protein